MYMYVCMYAPLKIKKVYAWLYACMRTFCVYGYIYNTISAERRFTLTPAWGCAFKITRTPNWYAVAEGCHSASKGIVLRGVSTPHWRHTPHIILKWNYSPRIILIRLDRSQVMLGRWYGSGHIRGWWRTWAGPPRLCFTSSAAGLSLWDIWCILPLPLVVWRISPPISNGPRLPNPQYSAGWCCVSKSPARNNSPWSKVSGYEITDLP